MGNAGSGERRGSFMREPDAYDRMAPCELADGRVAWLAFRGRAKAASELHLFFTEGRERRPRSAGADYLAASAVDESDRWLGLAFAPAPGDGGRARSHFVAATKMAADDVWWEVTLNLGDEQARWSQFRTAAHPYDPD
jgi:hypothetical protein